MSPETFGEMICAHNNTMYDVAEIQIDHVWEIDSEIELNSTIKEKLGLGNLEDEMFSFREIILRMFWDQWPESKVHLQHTELAVVKELIPHSPRLHPLQRKRQLHLVWCVGFRSRV